MLPNPFESFGHDFIFVFNFEAKVGENPAPLWFRTQYVNRTMCWVCGTEDNLTDHHVIPRLFRRYYDPNGGKSSHNWLSTVCCECHKKAELFNRPFFEGLHDFQNSDSERREFCKTKVAEHGGWDKFRLACAESWFKNKPFYSPRGYFILDFDAKCATIST